MSSEIAPCPVCGGKMDIVQNDGDYQEAFCTNRDCFYGISWEGNDIFAKHNALAEAAELGRRVAALPEGFTLIRHIPGSLGDGVWWQISHHFRDNDGQIKRKAYTDIYPTPLAALRAAGIAPAAAAQAKEGE